MPITIYLYRYRCCNCRAAGRQAAGVSAHEHGVEAVGFAWDFCVQEPVWMCCTLSFLGEEWGFGNTCSSAVELQDGNHIYYMHEELWCIFPAVCLWVTLATEVTLYIGSIPWWCLCCAGFCGFHLRCLHQEERAILVLFPSVPKQSSWTCQGHRACPKGGFSTSSKDRMKRWYLQCPKSRNAGKLVFELWRMNLYVQLHNLGLILDYFPEYCSGL